MPRGLALAGSPGSPGLHATHLIWAVYKHHARVRRCGQLPRAHDLRLLRLGRPTSDEAQPRVRAIQLIRNLQQHIHPLPRLALGKEKALGALGRASNGGGKVCGCVAVRLGGQAAAWRHGGTAAEAQS